jgi:hypothetical protein
MGNILCDISGDYTNIASSTLVECTIDFIDLHKELSPLNRTVTLQLPTTAVVIIVLV